jgi:hypothetical protein
VSSNRAFFTDLVNAAKANGVPLGVYTSASQVRWCQSFVSLNETSPCDGADRVLFLFLLSLLCPVGSHHGRLGRRLCVPPVRLTRWQAGADPGEGPFKREQLSPYCRPQRHPFVHKPGGTLTTTARPASATSAPLVGVAQRQCLHAIDGTVHIV